MARAGSRLRVTSYSSLELPWRRNACPPDSFSFRLQRPSMFALRPSSRASWDFTPVGWLTIEMASGLDSTEYLLRSDLTYLPACYFHVFGYVREIRIETCLLVALIEIKQLIGQTALVE